MCCFFQLLFSTSLKSPYLLSLYISVYLYLSGQIFFIKKLALVSRNVRDPVNASTLS